MRAMDYRPLLASHSLSFPASFGKVIFFIQYRKIILTAIRTFVTSFVGYKLHIMLTVFSLQHDKSR